MAWPKKWGNNAVDAEEERLLFAYSVLSSYFFFQSTPYNVNKPIIPDSKHPPRRCASCRPLGTKILPGEKSWEP